MIDVRRLLLVVSLCAAFSTSTLSLAGDFLRPTAKIERNDSRKIRLSITFAKLTVSDLATLEIKISDINSARDALIKYLDICAPKGDECGASVLKARYVQNPTLDKTAPVDQSTTLSAEIIGDSLSLAKDINADTFTLKAALLLASTEGVFDNTSKVSTKIIYGNPSVTELESAIEVGYSLGVKQDIKEPYVVSSKQSLTAAWTNLDAVTLSDGTTGTATNMLAILVPKTAINQNLSLPSHIYNADYTKQSTTADSTCSLSLSGESGSETCSISCLNEASSPQFLQASDFSGYESSGIQTTTVSLSANNAVSFNDLDGSETYAIVLQYVPDGLLRSCRTGTPSDAITLVQLETGREPKIGSSNCFVATAAYGSPLNHHLTSLRWFRDQYLLRSSLGRTFVQTYYEYGPRAAAWIADKPWVRALVRVALWAPVTLIETFHPLETLDQDQPQ